MKVLQSVTTELNNKIELLGEAGENKTLVIGVFHGDEPQGKYLIEEYLKSMQFFPQEAKDKDGEKNLLFIPCLNPDGMMAKTRVNANGVDLNRNFPTKNFGHDGSGAGDDPASYFGGKAPASEVETKFLISVIEKYKPKLVLTLHAPYKIVNYDGPAEVVAQKISDIIGYPVESSIGYPTPGSFGTYCGVERKVPTITLELDDTCPEENLKEPVFKIFNMLNKEGN